MKKHRYIKVKDPSCKNVNDMYANYSGLWNFLKLNKVQRRGDRGYMLWTNEHVYRLEVSKVPTTSREEV